ncbi:hypothetical protein M3Y96_01148200 [Aphelenchoides besseyi]|nr:hypothetical protein M3Y96_01148200 [Aphelenchoides besseyi]
MSSSSKKSKKSGSNVSSSTTHNIAANNVSFVPLPADFTRRQAITQMIDLIQILKTKLEAREKAKSKIKRFRVALSKHKRQQKEQFEEILMNINEMDERLADSLWLSRVLNIKNRPLDGPIHATTFLSNTKLTDEKGEDLELKMKSMLKRLEILESNTQSEKTKPKHELSLYGVVEMTDRYESTLKSLNETIRELKQLRKLPTIIKPTNISDGIRSMEEVDEVVRILDSFFRKLYHSLMNCQFVGSPGYSPHNSPLQRDFPSV